MFQGIDERMTMEFVAPAPSAMNSNWWIHQCRGRSCSKWTPSRPKRIAETTSQPAGPWCSETSWTKRHDTWAHAIASCSGSGGNPSASDRRRILDSRDRNGARRERDEGQGMRGVSRCLRVPRGTCGAQERTIETRGDPVVQGADEDSWARAVDLEATLLGGDRCGAALHCHSAALNALFVGQKDWFLIPPHRTTLSGMAAEKFWSSLFITS